MPTIATGSIATETLTTAQSVSFTCDPAEVALFQVTRSGVLVSGGRARNSQVIGPFAAGDVITITSQRGPVDYTLVAYTANPDVFTTAEVDSLQALVSGAGIPWAGHATAVTAGNGATQRFTIGSCDVTMRSDGTNWRPINGRALLFNRWASLASPVASLTSLTGSAIAFTTPDNLQIPADLLWVGASIRVEAQTRRVGAAGIAGSLIFRLGTANPAVSPGTNGATCALTIGATTNLDSGALGVARVTSATSFLSGGSSAPNGSSAGQFSDRTTQFNIASLMYISIESLTSTVDTLNLMGYSIWLEG